MHGTFDVLREAHPSQWLLIRTDGRHSGTGTLLFVDKDPDRVDDALLQQPKDPDKKRPLYITYFTYSWTIEDEEYACIL